MEQLYCGIDLHKEKHNGCIMDSKGNVVREREFSSRPEALERFITGIPNTHLTVAVEACGMWRPVHKKLTELGYTVKLANPLKTHQIATNKKTDWVDAKILADLLRTNYLPEVYIPNEETQKLRDLCRHKSSITRIQTQVKTKIKTNLLREGLIYPKNLWTKKMLTNFKKQNQDQNTTNLLNVYDCVHAEETEAKNRIEKISRANKQTTLLMSLPGVAEFSALFILAEIGDIKRFPTPEHLISYCGLCPGIYQSGSKEHTVEKHAVNKWLKWILYESSGKAATIDPRFMKHYYKIQKRKGMQTARRSTARKMATIIWHMLNNQEPYREVA